MKWLLQGNMGGVELGVLSRPTPRLALTTSYQSLHVIFPKGSRWRTQRRWIPLPTPAFQHLRRIRAPRLTLPQYGRREGGERLSNFLPRLHNHPPPSTRGFQSQLRPRVRVERLFRQCKPASLGHNGSWGFPVLKRSFAFHFRKAQGEFPRALGNQRSVGPLTLIPDWSLKLSVLAWCSAQARKRTGTGQC